MVHTAIGFKGTVDQVGEAKRMSLLGPRFRVASATDWALSVQATDRTVRVAAGAGEACGVTDTTNAAEDIQFPANTGGSDRFDLLVSRFVWTDPITLPAFTVLTGTVGAGGPDLTKLVRNPGTQYDAVLGVVRVQPGVGAFAPTDLFSLVPAGGVSGPLVIPQTAHMVAVDGAAGVELVTSASSMVTLWRHNGTGWAAVRSRGRLRAVDGVTTNSGGALVFPHGLGVAPASIQVSPGPQASDLLHRIGVIKVNSWGASDVVINFVRTDTSSYLLNSLVSLEWSAEA